MAIHFAREVDLRSDALDLRSKPRFSIGRRTTPTRFAIHLTACMPFGCARHETVLKDCLVSGLIPQGAARADWRSQLRRALDGPSCFCEIGSRAELAPTPRCTARHA